MEKMRSTFGFMRGNVRILTVCRILRGFSFLLASPYLSLYILALGGSPIEIGVVNAFGTLGQFILYPVGGYIADYKGRVKLVGILSYCTALSLILYIFAQNWVMLVIGQFLNQLFLFYLPAMSAIMADSLPPRQRGIGFATVMVIPSAVGIVAPLVGGYLIDLYGGVNSGVIPAMRICYTVGLVLNLIVATLRLKFLKETLEESDSEVRLRNIPLLLKTSYQHLLESLKEMPQTLWSLAVIEVVITLFVAMAGPLWIVFAVRDNEWLTATEWGTIALIAGVVGIVLSVPFGYLVDRYGSRRAILLALFLAPIPVFLFTFSKTFPAILVIILIITVVNTLSMPAFSRLIANIIPKEKRGRLFSVIGERGVTVGWQGGGQAWAGFFLFIPMMVGPLIGGYVYGVNPQYPWFMLTVSVISCLVLGYKFIQEPESIAG